MILKYILITLFVLVIKITNAQDSTKVINTDSTKLKDVFLKSKLDFSSRTFFSSTINEGALKDDYALASGAGVGIVTKSFHGFQFGIKGYFFYNLLSSHIDKVDSITLQPNRYEVGLFDVTNPTLKNNLVRLEDLFLKYTYSKSSITVGKININTPFLNPQDGRMRPTIEEGVWLNMLESKKIGFNGGWIWNVSPRSTVNWYSLQNSIGIYPSGINTDGSKSNYLNNIESSGIAIANFYYNPTENIKINVWDGLIDNVMNTAMIEINTQQLVKEKKITMYQGIQYLHQDAINHGGNINQLKTYVNEKSQSNIISVQFGIKSKRVNTSLNYTHITGDGRYLMPREWGKESFYTFLPRERNEGFGNVNAYMMKTSFLLLKNKLKTSISYGYYQLPDVKDFRLNKYGMPSYHQINYELSYAFDKFLKGLELKLLVAYKLKQGETYNTLKYEYNKVNMVNFNCILDFKL